MARGEMTHAIGLGARAGLSAEEAAEFIRATAAAAGVALVEAALFTLDKFAGEPGLREAAQALGLGLTFLPPAALRPYRDAVLTRSARVEALYGVGSIAEAAALAGAGPGARLLAPRAATARLTCAIARVEISPEVCQ